MNETRQYWTDKLAMHVRREANCLRWGLVACAEQHRIQAKRCRRELRGVRKHAAR